MAIEMRRIVLCSETKGDDQLGSYCEADLRLYFRICKWLVFSWCGSNVYTSWFSIQFIWRA